MVMSSIGKKELMALTGLGFVGFLLVHLAGNFTILKSAEAFDGYAEKLESLGPLILAAEAGMVVMALIHVALGVWLVLQNFAARGKRYTTKKWEGGRTLGSSTMWLTGPWILAFVGIHLAHFTIPHKFGEEQLPLSGLVADKLADPVWAIYYIVTMLLLGLHVSHGFWSAFQTLGTAPSRKGHFRDLAVLLGLTFSFGYGLLAFFVWFIPDLLQ
jgi:succinate dehydrogenase / fumarate reductase cytochrome b subunit